MKAPSILFIYAHPDDEALYSGGTIAKYAVQGANIYLITVTCGEKGRTSGECKPEELANVRKQELKKVNKILGIRKNFLLNYPDGAVGDVPVQEITAKIAEIIREIKPDILITFDKDGANGHRDHKAVHRYSLMAVDRAAATNETVLKGDPYIVQSIYYTNVGPEICAYLGLKYIDVGAVKLVDIKDFSQVKLEALKAHCTQTLSLSPFIGANNRILPYVFSEERFVMVKHYSANDALPYLK